nr:Hsp20/alpha crystallin family protein [uncultured Flavobacterium sp.]
MGYLAKTDSQSPVRSFLDDFFPNDLMDWGMKKFTNIGTTVPSVNLSETDMEYKIDLAAPGMKKEDFNVEIENNMISISSEKEDKKEDKSDNYTRREFSYQSFRRTFSLPDAAETKKIDATYTDGVLHITIPKDSSKMKSSKKTIQIH